MLPATPRNSRFIVVTLVVIAAIRTGRVVHSDETGWRIRALSKPHFSILARD
jgi:hypothetical protein